MHLDDYQLDQPVEEPGQVASLPVEQPQLLLQVLNTINDRVYAKDADGRIVLVNSAFLEYYRVTESEVIGRRFDDFLPAEMVQSLTHADQEVLEKGESCDCVVQFQHAQTRDYQCIEAHLLPMHDKRGQVVGVVGVLRDLTARRKAEDELKHQKNLLERIIATVPDEIFVKDRSRRIIIANHAFCKRHELNAGEAFAKPSAEYLSSDVESVSAETDYSVLREGKTVRRELTMSAEEGQIRQIEVSKMPLVEDGDIVGIVGVCRDLTESKAADRRIKENETLLLHASRLSSLGELAAMIAHEVNQPLFSIRNYAKAVENILKQEPTGEKLELDAVMRWVSQIHKEADRAGKITQRLKSFAKATDIQRKMSCMNRIVADSVDLLMVEAKTAGIVVESELSECLPEISVDRIQIQQVLVNLIKNAIEACANAETSDASVTVSTRVSSSSIEVSVADNGPGLSVEDGINILDPFKTTKHDGVGLGLAICNTIIDDHKGKLSYEINGDGGMTFCFQLPISD